MQCKIILPSGSRCQSVCYHADMPTCAAHACGRRSAMHKLDVTLPDAEPGWLLTSTIHNQACYKKDVSLGLSFRQSSTFIGST
jgi:hypothetical protein